jgi:hypothetical protein
LLHNKNSSRFADESLADERADRSKSIPSIRSKAIMTRVAQNASLDRPGDTKLYTVWISKVCTIRLLWSQMADQQRLQQISYEQEAIRRVAYIAMFNPCGLP